MKPARLFPGTKQHQALLNAIVSYYLDDPRILSVILFGSLGRGNWDEFSDLDIDVILRDGIPMDISEELLRLCQSFAGINERAAILIPEGDEGDIVLESLMQLSIRYHPLSQTSPNILDSMLILAGSLDAAGIVAAGKANRLEGAEPLNLLLDRCLRYTLGAGVEYHRGHYWAASEGLHRARAMLMDIYARTHGGYRGYRYFDTHAERWFQQKLGSALPTFDQDSLQESIIRTLDIIEGNLGYLSAGRLELTRMQKTILDRLRGKTGSSKNREG